jgi:hypothetical protein
MPSSTLKIHGDDSEVDRLIEKLERATELATGLMPYLQPRVQEADYSEPNPQAQRESKGKFFKVQHEMVGTEDGLTDAERAVADHLCAAVDAFGELDHRHPAEPREFVDGIHACQNQLAWRIVQRCFPKAWPIKSGSPLDALDTDPPPAPPADSEVRG